MTMWQIFTVAIENITRADFFNEGCDENENDGHDDDDDDYSDDDNDDDDDDDDDNNAEEGVWSNRQQASVF